MVSTNSMLELFYMLLFVLILRNFREFKNHEIFSTKVCVKKKRKFRQNESHVTLEKEIQNLNTFLFLLSSRWMCACTSWE